jgi:hypothetical protein
VTFLFRVDARHDGTFSLAVDDGPNGSRRIAGVSSGTVRGPRVNGVIVAGLSADWVTVRRDGVWELDVRAGFVTDDGATVLYSYTGLAWPADDGLRAVVRGAPRFTTGDERYAWLNRMQTVAVGEANLEEHHVAYDIFSLD